MGLFEWLALYPVVMYGLLSILGVLILVFLVAFFQGREITIWHLRIGGKPHREYDTQGSLLSESSPGVIVDREGYYYIVENGSRYHIPDPPTFEYLGKYLGFKWSDARVVDEAEAKKIKAGRPLPSILAHCPKGKSELVIHRGVWGSKGTMSDVTHQVRNEVRAGKIDIVVTRQLLGDPAHGQGKKIVVVYSCGGVVDSAEVEENGRLILPPVAKP
jgi:hypothetical protein